ncbi:transglutaminase-like cysteine peptidase [Desertibaculum subflavum]|uniref:transglutaminase-like cysteine peptidase n=1 Tax=Desertibaculum subflavum TaxID=2268458 RepID=UPI0013C4084A
MASYSLRLVGALWVLLVPLLLAWAPGAAAQPSPSFFGTTETRREGLTPFKKWTRVLEQHAFDETEVPNICRRAGDRPCPWWEWRRFLDQIKGREGLARLDAINRFMNRYRYVSDLANWGIEDYWETPNEFLNRDGDCEDFAIAKYKSLRALGFGDDQLRIVVLHDLNLRIAHAVLVVLEGGKAWVLDNQIDQVIDAERIRHYRPYYSINASAYWLHR